MKQSCNSDFIREAKYVAAFEVAKQVVCLKKFLMELVGRTTMVLFCVNNGVVALSTEIRNHRKGKHIEKKCHLIREIVPKGNVVAEKIPFTKNLVDPFIETLIGRVFDGHKDNIGVRCVPC